MGDDGVFGHVSLQLRSPPPSLLTGMLLKGRQKRRLKQQRGDEQAHVHASTAS
jgi:hypothetical protein